ncbi:MAG: DUF1320 domain-containing protein [Sphaerochaetaceae bacterium]
MNYCTLEDIRGHLPDNRLVELTDDTNPNSTGVIGTAVVGKAIEESSTLIDSYIGKRYALPPPMVPSVLRMICIDFSICALYDRRAELIVSEGMEARYKKAMDVLKSIAAGNTVLDIPLKADESSGSEDSFAAVYDAGEPCFTMDNMRF